MDFIRSSLKVSAAALLTAPVLLTPLASVNRGDSSAKRLAASPAPVVRTASLDHAMHAQHGMADPGPPVADDHGCMKCCSMCTVANAVLPAADTTVVFTISAHVFSRDHEARSGNTVAVDPGIPKRIV